MTAAADSGSREATDRVKRSPGHLLRWIRIASSKLMTKNLPYLPDGLGPTQVRKALRCSPATLERWVRDGRLPPDGKRIYRHPDGPRRWSEVIGRAWLPETIETAKEVLHNWYFADHEADKAQREAWQKQQRESRPEIMKRPSKGR